MATAAVFWQNEKSSKAVVSSIGGFPKSNKRLPRPDRNLKSPQQTIELAQVPGFLPRTDAHAIETEILSYRILKRLNLPVPSIVGITRNKSTSQVVSAIIIKPEGVPLESVDWSAYDARRSHVEAQIDHAKLVVSEQKSVSFGTVTAVTLGKGLQSWPLAFAVMFESLLEDGEDHFVNLPYPDIRRLLANGKATLDTCSRPHLVIPYFGRSSYVLVDQTTGRVSAYLGCRDAYWGDPDLINKTTLIPVYRCYQAVKTIIKTHLRPSSVVGSDVLEARSNMMAALRGVLLPDS